MLTVKINTYDENKDKLLDTFIFSASEVTVVHPDCADYKEYINEMMPNAEDVRPFKALVFSNGVQEITEFMQLYITDGSGSTVHQLL